MIPTFLGEYYRIRAAEYRERARRASDADARSRYLTLALAFEGAAVAGTAADTRGDRPRASAMVAQ